MKPQTGQRHEFVNGQGGFRWSGVLLEGNPSANPANRPRIIRNGRVKGGDIVNRDGLSKFNTSVLDASNAHILHMADYQISRPKRLWILGNGCPGISSSAGFYVGHLDPEQEPEFQRAVNYSSLTLGLVIGRFGSDLYIGSDDTLRKLELIAQPYGTENLAISGSSQDVSIKTFTGFTITWLKEFDGRLFIGLSNGASSKIATWDGVSIQDDLTGINPPTCAAVFRAPDGGDALVVGFASATNLIKYRVTGSDPGTWANVAPGAGTLGSLSMTPFKDKLYIADDSGEVWTWDPGTSLTATHTPASATACRAVEANEGFLYVGYETLTAARIAKYDGSSWTDVEKDITAQYTGVTSIRALSWYRNFLYAGATKAGAGKLYLSSAGSTSGSYGEITPNALNNGAINSLLVA